MGFLFLVAIAVASALVGALGAVVYIFVKASALERAAGAHTWRGPDLKLDIPVIDRSRINWDTPYCPPRFTEGDIRALRRRYEAGLSPAGVAHRARRQQTLNPIGRDPALYPWADDKTPKS